MDSVSFGIWDISTGKRLIKRQGGSQGAEDINWRPDSNQLATTDISNSTVLFDALTGQEISYIAGGTIIDWNSTGTFFVVGSNQFKGIDIFNFGSELPELSFGQDLLTFDIDWSLDDQKISSISIDNTLRIWDANNGQQLNLFNVVDPIAIKFSPNSRYVAVGTGEGLVLIFDTATNTQVAQFSNLGAVYALDWSPDGTQLAYGGEGTNGEITIVEVNFLAN